MAGRPQHAPLSRFTVLEMTVARAGPTAARQLADWGANVIRIEPPAGKTTSLGSDEQRHAPDFQNLHRNKRSVALDLKHPDGLRVFRRMAERADVLIENFRPEVKHRLGIDYETLSAVNPRLIYASISGFGQDGPYRERPGVDQIAQGMGGLMSITGEPGRGPMRVGIPIADLCTGLFTAFGIVTALMEREVSGKGQSISASLLQSQIFMLDLQAARWLIDGEVPTQAGNNHPTGVPTGVFRTRDGHINIAPIPPMWRKFCAAIDADFADHPDFALPASRLLHRERLNALIEDITIKFDSAALTDRLNEAGIPCGPIYSIEETFADPQVRHLGVTGKVVSPKLGELEILRQPLDFSRTKSALYAPTPERGEHTDEVLAEFGVTADERQSLRASGAVA